MSDIKDKILSHQNLEKDIFDIKDVSRDGNCFYRTLSLYFTNDESYFKFFREQIYLAALNYKESLKEFFFQQEDDPILVNQKLDGYIEKIKENKFFAGIIEINMAAKIFNLNIAIYELINNNTYYTPYAIFKPDTNTKEYILLYFSKSGEMRIEETQRIL